MSSSAGEGSGYVETEWENGITPINDDNLNKIEHGIAANSNDITLINAELANLDTRLDTFEYNLVSNGSAVKTGRQVEGKDEYVKRYHFTSINSTNTFTKNLGFILSSVIITKSYGMAYSNSHNWFPISMGDFNNVTNYAVRYSLYATDDVLQLITANGNFSEAYIEIYYINRNE